MYKFLAYLIAACYMLAGGCVLLLLRIDRIEERSFDGNFELIGPHQ